MKIAFVFKMRSGKDNCVDYLISKHGGCKISFAKPLYKALYTVSSVSGAEGAEADTSGRGGLGKGEVLCVLLTKGGKSGGTSGTDLSSESGKVVAEVKAGPSTNFKIPFVAKRVARLPTLSKLDDIYAICKPAMTTVPKSWDKFMADRNESVNKQMIIKNDSFKR